MDGTSPLQALASRSFCRVADAQQTTGNQVRLLRDGPETFPEWLSAINAAQKYVKLENYILQEDELGAQFAAALGAAAARGVQCQVIYDWLGCLTRTSSGFWQKLRHAGVNVRRYKAKAAVRGRRIDSISGREAWDLRKTLSKPAVPARVEYDVGQGPLHPSSVGPIYRSMVQRAFDVGALADLTTDDLARLLKGTSAHSTRVGLNQDLFASGEGASQNLVVNVR